MTYDEMIARGIYGTGKRLQMRQRVADYRVDGNRLGSIDWQTKSSVSRDRRLPKEAREILGTASILSLLAFQNVRIISLDHTGRKLERPDLDVKFSDGTEIAVEQADVAPPAEAKHDAETGGLEAYFWSLLDNDKSFLGSFGNNNVIVFLSSHLVGKLHVQGQGRASVDPNRARAVLSLG